MSVALDLPTPSGAVVRHTLRGTPVSQPDELPSFPRLAIAAAHVVADPLRTDATAAAIDWPATMRYRRHLLDCGFDLAEAMDTAQRGMGLGWTHAIEMIGRSVDMVGPAQKHRIFAGAGTDHLQSDLRLDGTVIADAYLRQVDSIQECGARIILMASRELAAWAREPEDYLRCYERVLSACDSPVILHWLGEAFDPALRGYWSADDFDAASNTVLAIVEAARGQVSGIKLSLLNKNNEIDLRRRLQGPTRLYTGDDFNYPELIAGDEEGHSEALLGVFDPIAVPAAAALSALGRGDQAEYRHLMDATLPLARHMFDAPTSSYKTGVVFIAWLNGFQDHFVMLNGGQSQRSILHLVDLFRLADIAGVLRNPEQAAERFGTYLRLHGVS